MKIDTYSSKYLNKLYDDGARCFDDLNDDEQKKLTSLIMMDKCIFDRYEFITECKRSDETIQALIDYMHSFDKYQSDYIQNIKDHAEKLVEIITNNAVDYAKNRIDKMFEDKQYFDELYKKHYLKNYDDMEMVYAD